VIANRFLTKNVGDGPTASIRPARSWPATASAEAMFQAGATCDVDESLTSPDDDSGGLDWPSQVTKPVPGNPPVQSRISP
jgi:hypothetical protein